jgi:hypothetical protein
VPEEKNIDNYKKDDGEESDNKILKPDEFSFDVIHNDPVEQHQPFSQDANFLVQLSYLCLCTITGTYASQEKDDARKIYLADKGESILVRNDGLLQDLRNVAVEVFYFTGY